MVAELLQALERFLRLSAGVISIEEGAQEAWSPARVLPLDALHVAQNRLAGECAALVLPPEQPHDRVRPPAIGSGAERAQIFGDVRLPVRRIAVSPLEARDQCAW